MLQFRVHSFLTMSIKAGVRLTRHFLRVNPDKNLLTKPVGKLKLISRQLQNAMLGFYFVPIGHHGNMVKCTDQPFIQTGSIPQSVLIKPEGMSIPSSRSLPDT